MNDAEIKLTYLLFSVYLSVLCIGLGTFGAILSDLSCAFGTWKLARALGARFISGVFALFNFLSCLYIVPLPKRLTSRLSGPVVPACNTLSTRKDLWEWGRLSQQKQVRKHEGTCVKRAARVWSDETV